MGIAVVTHGAQHDPAGFAVEEIVGLQDPRSLVQVVKVIQQKNLLKASLKKYLSVTSVYS